jgi:hypothetical protein
MTFPIFGGELAPGIVDTGAAIVSGTVRFDATAIDLTVLRRLDRRSFDPRLGCRWVREIDGRLACLWAPDIVPIPQR